MVTRICDLPKPENYVEFTDGFAPRSLLTVDTEEEFDWNSPFSASDYGLTHLPAIADFQEFCEGIGVSPVYLVDWPVATSPVAQEILRPAIKAGKAEIGIQLHPWVNPPFDEQVTSRNSFAGNLPPALERDKFLRLRDAIAANFDTAPQIYRAGRYGLGEDTARILKEAGIPVDSSVRAKFDYSGEHGPNFDHHPQRPWWVDDERSLIELPLTTVFSGRLRNYGDALFPFIGDVSALAAGASRSGLLERIPLTPEGVPQDDALRAVGHAVDDGLPLLVLSFHSPSLVPDNTPYVENDEQLAALYEWWRTVYAEMAARGVRPTTVSEIMKASGLNSA